MSSLLQVPYGASDKQSSVRSSHFHRRSHVTTSSSVFSIPSSQHRTSTGASSTVPRLVRRGGGRRRPVRSFPWLGWDGGRGSIIRFLLWTVGVLLVIFVLVMFQMLSEGIDPPLDGSTADAIRKEEPPSAREGGRKTTKGGALPLSSTIQNIPGPERTMTEDYTSWKEFSVQLAAKEPSEVLDILNSTDPYGVRTFERKLVEREMSKGRTLKIEDGELDGLFTCPSAGGWISRPSFPDESKARAFRRKWTFDTMPETNDPDSDNDRNGNYHPFLFFQHLRKAGGTHFCTLVSAHIPKRNVPPYYCMPDWEWSGHRTAGYLHGYTAEALGRKMTEGDYAVAGNEWHNFWPDEHFDLNAVLATSFRRPLDRALSQYRFECVEDRGCDPRTTVEQYWQRRADLKNIYTTTFADEKLAGWKRSLRGGSGSVRRAEALGKAMDVVSRFHLVLVMEWLAYAAPLVDRVLGLTPDQSSSSLLTRRVRPHATGVHRRNDHQETNRLGSAGIAEASWTPEDKLAPATRREMGQDLALDEILTDVAQRFFLERLFCDPTNTHV